MRGHLMLALIDSFTFWFIITKSKINKTTPYSKKKGLLYAYSRFQNRSLLMK
jgi:hypothetical protein